MGKQALAGMGKMIAKELRLDNPESLTGHCFQRSSATAAANEGADTVDLILEGTALRDIDNTKER